MRALSTLVLLTLCISAWAEDPAWTYGFSPGLQLEYLLVGTYHSSGVSTQRIVPQGDSSSPTISAGGDGLSTSGGTPPFATHDGGGQGSLRILIQVDEVDGSGKATCSVQFSRMSGKFDAPGMAGACFPLGIFPQIHGRPFRVVIAPDGGLPDLADFDTFLRDQLGAETPPARIDVVVRETRRALAACFPALPEPPGRAGASYRVGEYTYTVGPQKIVDGKKAILVASDTPEFDNEREQGKIKITEKGGSWSRFWYGRTTPWSIRYEEKHWRNWAQKARTALGQRTDMTETITYAASLQKVTAPKPEDAGKTETPDEQK